MSRAPSPALSPISRAPSPSRPRTRSPVRFRSKRRTLGPEYVAAMERVTIMGAALRDEPERVTSHRLVVLKAVTQDGKALQHATGKARDDRMINLAAVRQNGLALQHATNYYRADEQVVLEAVRQNPEAFWFAYPEVQMKPEIILTALAGRTNDSGIAIIVHTQFLARTMATIPDPR